MPSGFTHIFLAQTFSENAKIEDHDLGLLLAANIKYFQLGALGPDLPYSQQMELLNRKQALIADDFHYRKTNNIPIRAFNRVKALTGEEKDQAYAFFLGYTAHVVADGIIHPFIRDKVGNYKGNETAHRTLEMRIDVLFLDFLTKGTGHSLNLNNTNLHQQILDPLSRNFDHIAIIFSRLIYEVYNHKVSKDEVVEWIRDMNKVFGIAEGNNHFYAHLPIFRDYLFHDLDDVVKNRDEDILLKKEGAQGRDVNFAGRDINFFGDCLPAFYKAFKKVAMASYEFVYNDGPIFDQKILPAINLDTGRSLLNADGNDLNGKAIYWENI